MSSQWMSFEVQQHVYNDLYTVKFAVYKCLYTKKLCTRACTQHSKKLCARATKMGTLDLAALDLEGCEAASDLVDLTALDLRLDGAMQSVCTGEFGGRNDTSVVRRVSHRSRDFGSDLIESNYCRVHKTNNSILE